MTHLAILLLLLAVPFTTIGVIATLSAFANPSGDYSDISEKYQKKL